MDKTFVKMLKDFGDDYKSDEVYELDSKTAKSWIEAGLAEETNPQDDLACKFSKALEERDNALIKAINDSVKVESKAPSKVKSDDKAKSLGDFATLVYKATAVDMDADEKQKARNEIKDRYKASLQASNGTTGGYTVPEDFIADLVEHPDYPSVFRNRATTLPAGNSETIKLPALDQSITPDGNGQTAWNAGINVFWASEGDSATETNPKFRSIELHPERLTAYIPVSNHLMRTSAVAVERIIRRLFRRQVVSKLEYSYLLGHGAGQPLGMLNTSNGIAHSVNRDTNNTIKYADVCNMWEALPASSQGNAIWLVGQKAIAALLQMEDGNGNNVFHPNAQAGVDMRLFNRPVLVSEFLPSVGTAQDLSLLDPTMYYVGESLQPTMSASEHVNFLKDEVVLKMESWADGQPAINYKPTLGDGSATVSPSVYLAA